MLSYHITLNNHNQKEQNQSYNNNNAADGSFYVDHQDYNFVVGLVLISCQ